MNIDNLTIGEAKALAAMFAGAAAQSAPAMIKGDGRKVIVRSRDAGVLFGKLVGYSPDGALVHLADARQMWSWAAKSGGTLIDCATVGVKAGKFSTTTSAATIINACAIIDVSDVAALSLEAASWA